MSFLEVFGYDAAVAPDAALRRNDAVCAIAKQRKRCFAPKTRTGCIFCKTRKVKCDEGKPSCKRCLDRGQACAYIIPRAKIFELKATTVGSQATPRIIPLTIRYGDSQESSSLAFFVKRTGPMLSMASCTKDFWSVFVPQASWKFAAVKHMLVALSLFDQYVSSPMWTLMPNAAYALALKSYNKAIKELTTSSQPPSCVLLTSVLAWMFESISNHPDGAKIHMAAAKGIAAELHAGDQRALSVEECNIINTIEGELLGDSYTFLEVWAPEEGRGTPEAFQTINEARAALAAVIQTMKAHRPARTDLALGDLRRWRISFEAYRYQRVEPLAQKRQVFLHHNIVISCVAFQHFSSLTPKKNGQILVDAEALCASEDVDECCEGLLLLLNFMLEDENLEERPRVEKLRSRLERSRPMLYDGQKAMFEAWLSKQ